MAPRSHSPGTDHRPANLTGTPLIIDSELGADPDDAVALTAAARTPSRTYRSSTPDP
jgi:hypothetical protein